MRDAHRIKEQSAFGDLLATLVRSGRTLVLVIAAFAAGRFTAPVSEQQQRLPQTVASQPSLESPPDAPEPTLSRDSTPARSKENGKERRTKMLVGSSDPQALPDGLLPEQVGTPKLGEYSVQVASFASRQEARAFCQQLTRRGFHPHVAEARPSSQPHRVRLGRFARRELAQSYRGRLAQADITASVVRVD